MPNGTIGYLPGSRPSRTIVAGMTSVPILKREKMAGTMDMYIYATECYSDALRAGTVDQSIIDEYNTLRASYLRRMDAKKADVEKRAKDLLPKRAEGDLLEEGITRTVMAIRERMMKYFKGDCVEQYGFGVRLTLTSVNEEHSGTNYFYERRERENANRRLVILNDTVVMALRKEPDEAVFFPGVMTRSPEMEQVYELLKDFFAKYLGGVQLTEDTAAKWNKENNGEGDRKMMLTVAQKAFAGVNQRQPGLYTMPPDVVEFTTIPTDILQTLNRWRT